MMNGLIVAVRRHRELYLAAFVFFYMTLYAGTFLLWPIESDRSGINPVLMMILIAIGVFWGRVFASRQ